MNKKNSCLFKSDYVLCFRVFGAVMLQTLCSNLTPPGKYIWVIITIITSIITVTCSALRQAPVTRWHVWHGERVYSQGGCLLPSSIPIQMLQFQNLIVGSSCFVVNLIFSPVLQHINWQWGIAIKLSMYISYSSLDIGQSVYSSIYTMYV